MAQYRDTKLAKAAKVVSFDAEKNTIKVLFYTGAYVERYRAAKSGWEKYFLGFDMDKIDASRFEKGVGLFLDHYTIIENQVGHSVPGTLEKTDAGYVATFELEDVSEFPPENTIRRAVEKLKAGLANEFSMGVDWDSQTEELKSGVAYVTATNWQPYEVSLVGVDADHGTTSLEKEGKMPEVTEKQGQVAPNEAELRREGARLERERAAGIEMLGKKFKVEELAAKHIKDGTDLATAREEILLAAQARIESAPVPNPAPAALASSTVPVVTVGKEAAERVRAGVVEALAFQLGHGEKPAGNEFAGMSMLEMAEELAAARGENLTKRQIKNAILKGGQASLGLTPSDFPVIIGEASNVFLMGQGMMEDQAFSRIGTREDLPNMNAVKGIDTVFDVAVTKAIQPGEHYPDAKLTEGSQPYQLEKRGAFLRLTEEVLDAERVGAISTGLRQGAYFFKRLESTTFYSQMFGTDGLGIVMADGKKFFHTDHANLASAAALDATKIEELMKLIRKQKKGSMSMNLPSAAIIVPAALELTAEKIIRGDFTPSTAAAAKLPRVRSLDIIVDSAMDDITTTGYAVITDPRLLTIMSYGWKIGEEGVQLDSPYWDHETDTWAYKFKDRFGAAPMDYRGAAFNPGAGS